MQAIKKNSKTQFSYKKNSKFAANNLKIPEKIIHWGSYWILAHQTIWLTTRISLQLSLNWMNLLKFLLPRTMYLFMQLRKEQ